MSKRALAIVFVAQAVAAWAWLSGAGPGFPLDDAWVHQVYARSVASGEIFAYNPGDFEAGVTSPLWTLLCAIPVAIAEHLLDGARPDLGVRLLGGLIGFLATVVAARLTDRAGKWPAMFALLAMTLDPLILRGRFSGMEQPLFAWLLLLFVEALLDEDLRRLGWVSGLLMLTRPEGALVAVIGLVTLLLRGRRPWSTLLPMALCLAPWMAYCFVVNGTPFPNTFAQKAALVTTPGALWEATATLFGDTGVGWALPVLLLAGTISLDGGHRRLGRLPVVVGVALLAGVLFTRPLETQDGLMPYYWQRYALLGWPLLLIVASAGVASLVRTAWAGVFCKPAAAAVLMAPLLAVVVFGHGWPAHAWENRARFAAEVSDVEAQQVAAGMWIGAHLPEDALIATHDAGAVTYFSRRRVLDIWGNNDADLARAIASGDPAAPAAVLSAYEPDALAVFPIQWAAGNSPDFVAWLRAAEPSLAASLDQLSPGARAQAVAGAAATFGFSDYAGFFGLTRVGERFHVEEPSTVPGPLQRDFVVFVRP